MDGDSRLLLCGLLACVALAGCSAFGGGSVEVTPANDTVSVKMTVEDDDAIYVAENDTVSVVMTSYGERTELPYDDYACMKARTHAGDVVGKMIKRRIAGDPSGYSASVGAERVEVAYYSDLSVSPSALEKVTPERVVVSVHAFEQETRCVVPVRVSDGGVMEPL